MTEKKKSFLQELKATFFAGMLITVATTVIHHYLGDYVAAITSVQARLADFVTYVLAGDAADTVGPHRESPRIVLINFSDMPEDVATRGPGVNRRDLAHLVRIADEGHAAAVLLDVNLSGQGPDNKVLRDAFSALQHTDVVIPALLTRRLTSQACGYSSPAAEGGNSLPTATRFMIDQDILNGGDLSRVWIGHDDVEFDFDGRVRSYCPFVSASRYGVSGESVDVPSMALIAAEIARENLIGASGRPDAMLSDTGCGGSGAFIKRAALNVRSKNNERGSRKDPCGAALLPETPYPIRFVQSGDTRDIGPHSLPPLQFEVMEISDPAQIKPADLARAIVVIGSTDLLSHDFKVTPIGEMPGVMLLVNQIYDASTIDFSRGAIHPAEWGALVGEVLLVGAGSLIFVFLTHCIPEFGSRGIKKLGAVLHYAPNEPGFHASAASRYRNGPWLWLRVSSILVWGVTSTGMTLLGLLALLLTFSTAAHQLGYVLDMSGAALGMLFDIGARIESSFGKAFH